MVAIAPVDGQYRPSDKPTPVTNGTILIHGSHDGDVSTFSGLPIRAHQVHRRWRLVQISVFGLSRESRAVELGLGQQGQWPRSGRFLDLRGLLPPEAQRRFAEVTITAVSRGDALNASASTPPVPRPSRRRRLAPEDHVHDAVRGKHVPGRRRLRGRRGRTTGSGKGIKLVGTRWPPGKEALVPFRTRNSTMFHNAAWIGWNNRIAGDDTTKMGRPAAYEIALGDSLRSAWRIDRSSAIVFSLAATDAKPGPRAAPKDTTKKDSTAKKAAPPRRPPPRPPRGPDTTVFDLSVEVVDAAGTAAKLPLSAFGPVRRLRGVIYRRSGRDKRDSEASRDRAAEYVIRSRMAQGRSTLDLDRVTKVRCSSTARRRIHVLDNIGFSRISRDFLIANGSDR